MTTTIAPPPSDAPPVAVAITPTPRARAAVLIALLTVGVVALLVPFATGLLGATLLYVIGVGPYRWLARHMREGLAATVVVTGIVVLIVGPLTWMLVQLTLQASHAIAGVQQGGLLARLELALPDSLGGQDLAKSAGMIVSWLSAHFVSFLDGAGLALINFGVAFLGLYYLLRAPAGTWTTVRDHIPFSASTADALRERYLGVAEATVLGTGVVALAQGTLIGLAFALFGLPGPVFWGAVALLASFIPMVGATVVWLPATLVLLSQNRYGAAVAMVITGSVICGNIDNLLRPLVYRRVPHMHPMITLVGALAGIRVFGVIGLLLGPLLIYLMFELMRFFSEEYGAS